MGLFGAIRAFAAGRSTDVSRKEDECFHPLVGVVATAQLGNEQRTHLPSASPSNGTRNAFSEYRLSDFKKVRLDLSKYDKAIQTGEMDAESNF